MPKSDVPGLLEIAVRFFVPARRSAAIRFSGMPQTPKPPIRIEAPSGMRRTAASALATLLSIRYTNLQQMGRVCINADTSPSREANSNFNANCEGVYRRRWRQRTPPPVRAGADGRADVR